LGAAKICAVITVVPAVIAGTANSSSTTLEGLAESRICPSLGALTGVLTHAPESATTMMAATVMDLELAMTFHS
jgi:hypothetical protein